MVPTHPANPQRVGERPLTAFAVIAIAALLLVGIAGRTQSAAAASSSGLDYYAPGSTDYGLHFDEISFGDFGAYDYPLVVNTEVDFKAKVASTLAFPTRYKYKKNADCRLYAIAQIEIVGTFYDVTGWDVHFLHIDKMPSSWTYTNAIKATNTQFDVVVGEVDNCGFSTGAHAHMAIDMSGYIEETSKTDDTCWSTGSECADNTKSIGTVRKDKGSGTCPPSTQDGTASKKSGSVTRYVCATWQFETGHGGENFNLP